MVIKYYLSLDILKLKYKTMGLFETLGETLNPENSLLSKSIDGYKKEAEFTSEEVLTKKAEKEISRIVEPGTTNYKTLVFAYMLGYQDATIERKKNEISHSKNLLEL